MTERKLFDEEINLFALVGFLRSSAMTVVACGLVGAILAGVFWATSEPKYEATAQLVLAKVSMPSRDDPDAIGLVESRERLLLRLRSPSIFDATTVSTCSETGSASSQQLSRDFRVTSPSVPGDVIALSFTARTAASAGRCLEAIVQFVESAQMAAAAPNLNNLKAQIAADEARLADNVKLLTETQSSEWQKAIYLTTRDDAISLREDISRLEFKLALSESAKLIAPIYTEMPAGKVRIVAAGLLTGLLIGLGASFAKRLYTSQRARSQRVKK